jgi:hypothetical protein
VSAGAAPVGPVRRGVRLAHLLVVLAGLLVLAYPFTVGAAPDVSCRGQVMQPGDSCAKADGSGVQTYEQRARDLRNARPVIGAGGLLVAAFGVILLRGELRRSGTQQASGGEAGTGAPPAQRR